MLISISGAFSSGKTTLVRRACDEIPGLSCVEEIATAARTAFPELDWRLPDVRAYLFWAQQLAERTRLSDERIWLLDGSLIDVFAHARAFGSAIPEHWFEAASHQYDRVFVCDTDDVAIENNNIRETDPNLRTRIQRIMLEESVRYGKCPPVVLSGDVAARIDMLRRHLILPPHA